MSAKLAVLLPEDGVLIARMSRILARRLVHGNDAPAQRQALMRALFGLQRLPNLIAGVNLSISADRFQLQLDYQHCGFVSYTEDWHTEFRLQYFPGSWHCIAGYEHLDGEEKLAATMLRLDDFEVVMEETAELSVEDHSIPGAADGPPINDYLAYEKP